MDALAESDVRAECADNADDGEGRGVMRSDRRAADSMAAGEVSVLWMVL